MLFWLRQSLIVALEKLISCHFEISHKRKNCKRIKTTSSIAVIYHWRDMLHSNKPRHTRQCRLCYSLFIWHLCWQKLLVFKLPNIFCVCLENWQIVGNVFYKSSVTGIRLCIIPVKGKINALFTTLSKWWVTCWWFASNMMGDIQSTIG